MSATVKFYRTSSPARAISKTLGSALATYTVELPPDFDIDGGDLIITGGAATAQLPNYCTISDPLLASGLPSGVTLSYFVDKRRALGGTGGFSGHYGMRYTLRLDVLATYAADIRAGTYYVARNEFNSNPQIIDPLHPPEYTEEKRLTISNMGVASDTDRCYVLVAAGLSWTCSYVMDAGNLLTLITAIWSHTSFRTAFQTNPANNILRLFSLPHSVSYITTCYPGMRAVDHIKLGYDDIAPSGFTAYEHLNGIADVQQIMQTGIDLERDGNDWKNNGDYYRFILPYCGEITLGVNDIFSAQPDGTTRRINARYSLDITTGACIAQLYTFASLKEGTAVNFHTYSCRGNMASDIAISTQSMNGLISSIIGGVIGVGSNALMGNISGEITAAINGNFAQGKAASATTITGNIGGSVSDALPKFIYVYYHHKRYPTISNYAHTKGLPCHKTLIGSTLSGFTVCENTDIHPAYASENSCAEIKTLLESGVYF